MSIRLLFLFILIARLASAQEAEERPDLSIPEPEPQRPSLDTFTIVLAEYQEAVKERDLFIQALPRLIGFLQQSTDIEIDLRTKKLPLFDARVMDALMIYMTGQDAHLRLYEEEKKNLGKYLKQGGFLFAEDVVSGGLRGAPPSGGGVEGTPFDRQFKALMKDPQVLGTQGGSWRKIPKKHPLYSNYFDFLDGPPLSATTGGNVFDLEMLEYRGRIAVVFSDLNISWYWATQDAEGRDRYLQMGVNLVVQALTQRFAGAPLPTRGGPRPGGR
jgi:hypothetical protein